MKKWFIAPLITLLMAFSTGCFVEDGTPDSRLTIVNESSYAIYEIRIAEVGETVFSSDLLAGDVLLPGQSLDIYVYCDVYDILVIDEDGYECVLPGLDLCFDDAVWVIDDFELASCTWSL